MELKLFSLILLFSYSISIQDLSDINDESTYCTTWSSSQYLTKTYNLPPISFENNSIRQFVRVSASGEKIRIKFSNKFGISSLQILSANIADSISQDSGEIDLDTLTPLAFDGKKDVIIPPGEDIYSDTFSYPLKALSEVAISIYFGNMPIDITGHAHSQTNNFVEEGNKINNKQFSKDIIVNHWYILSAVEISSTPRKKAVICFGDSITDGVNNQGRWSNYLAEKLNKNEETSEIAVVNEGIGGHKITTDGLNRYSSDVLDIKGATYIVVLFGVNDINQLNRTAEEVILAYKELIRRAHRNNMIIYGGTILPYGKNTPWTPEREEIRKEINKWIRNSKNEEGGYDGFIDFDKVMKDPNDEKYLLNDYDCGDGIHPSNNGNKAMINAFDDLSLFTKEPNFNEIDYLKKIEIIDKIGIKYKLDFNLDENEEIKIRINGTCNGSKGFRVLAVNNEGVKNSDYFYTGKIEKGEFEYIVNLKIINVSNYVVIRRPMSTINIDNITLNFIEIETENNVKLLSPGEDGVFI